ncbi:response regulator [Demequina maris]|uniref:response regulator n=1 Tax=Demequina maris TaxID=1638982 RepID=UPI003F702D3E
MMLEIEPDLEVVGEASDGAEAVLLARAATPDVMLMDVRMPGMDGIAATARVAAEHPDLRVIMLTTFDLDEYVFEALEAGASGFLLKDVEPELLIAGVRAVHAGDALLAPSITRRLIDTVAASRATPRSSSVAQLGALTPRELEVLTLMATGLTNGEIAARFVVSETTVKTHVGRVLAKLGARDRVQAVIAAYEHRLVEPGR